MAKQKGRLSFHVKLPEKIPTRARQEARKFQKTIDGITEAALGYFFSQPDGVRRECYGKIPNKIFGRPIQN